LGRSLPADGGEQSNLGLSRIGGSPAWPLECRSLPSRAPSAATAVGAAGNGPLVCALCGAPLALVGQFAAGYDNNPRRLLQVFACSSAGACGGATDAAAWRVLRVTSACEPAAAGQQQYCQDALAESSSAAVATTAGGTSGADMDEDWGISHNTGGDDDWGAVTATAGDGDDDELDALLLARDSRAAAATTASASSTAAACSSGGGGGSSGSTADVGTAEEEAWTGKPDPSPADTWPCYALEIYDEPTKEAKSGEHERELLERYLKSGLADEDGGSGGGRAGADAALPQEVLQELSAEEDKLRADAAVEEEDEMMDDVDGGDVDLDGGVTAEWLHKFQRRIERSPAQAIRYSWGGQPLWMAPPARELAAGTWPPPCTRCGAARIFELQLLPTLLSQLRSAWPKESPGLAMDWGTVVIYTCGEDCAADEPSEEFVVVQAGV